MSDREKLPYFDTYAAERDWVPKYTVYHCYGTNGEPERSIRVNYNEVNELLNRGIGSLNDLVAGGAIEDVTEGASRKLSTFDEIKPYLRKSSQQILQNKVKIGLDGMTGGFIEERQLIELVNADNVKEIERMRFQNRSNLSYDNVTSFLESVGITSKNINKIPGDFVSVDVTTPNEKHALCLTVDIGKIRKIGWENADRSNDVFIYGYDSSRIVGDRETREKGYTLDGIAKNCRMLNWDQQKYGSCWYNSAASVLTAAKDPDLIGEIRSGGIELQELNRNSMRELGNEEAPNNFMLKQMGMLQEIAEKSGISSIGDKPLAEQLVRGDLVDRVLRLSEKEQLLEQFEKKAREVFENIEKERRAVEPDFKFTDANVKEIMDKHKKTLLETPTGVDDASSRIIVEENTNDTYTVVRENKSKFALRVTTDHVESDDDDKYTLVYGMVTSFEELIKRYRDALAIMFGICLDEYAQITYLGNEKTVRTFRKISSEIIYHSAFGDSSESRERLIEGNSEEKGKEDGVEKEMGAQKDNAASLMNNRFVTGLKKLEKLNREFRALEKDLKQLATSPCAEAMKQREKMGLLVLRDNCSTTGSTKNGELATQNVRKVESRQNSGIRGI
ncbi:MAG: hypothetical protein LBB24_03800 [Rickettsiales bacterium]|jgi:hypothetical protein|nr:hypothetical protein [Rickettsiales bacterium]